MDFKIFNRQKQVLRFAPNRNDIEVQGLTFKVDIDKTLEKLKKEYSYTVFFNDDIVKATRKAKRYGITGLVIATNDFVVLGSNLEPLDNRFYIRSFESNIKNQTKRHNLGNDGKAKLMTARARVENFKCYAMGISNK